MILNIGILIVLVSWFLIGALVINKARLELSEDTISAVLLLLCMESFLFIGIIYFIQRILG